MNIKWNSVCDWLLLGVGAQLAVLLIATGMAIHSPNYNALSVLVAMLYTWAIETIVGVVVGFLKIVGF